MSMILESCWTSRSAALRASLRRKEGIFCASERHDQGSFAAAQDRLSPDTCLVGSNHVRFEDRCAEHDRGP